MPLLNPSRPQIQLIWNLNPTKKRSKRPSPNNPQNDPHLLWLERGNIPHEVVLTVGFNKGSARDRDEDRVGLDRFREAAAEQKGREKEQESLRHDAE